MKDSSLTRGKNSENRESKIQALRLLQISEKIREGTYPNAPSLQKEFEVSRSTIMRDIEFLKSRYNLPIEYSAEHKGYYFTDPTVSIKSFMLSEGELFTISTLIPLMEQYKNTPLEATYKSLSEKLLRMLPSKVEVDSSIYAEDITFIKDPLPEISEKIFNSVFAAIKVNKTLSFSYRSISKKEYTPREFDPYKVLCQKGNWYIAGYCHLHKRINIYALSRIKDLEVTEKSFEIQPDFNINDYIDPDFGLWHSENKKFKIELLFSSSVNTYIMERIWHENQECSQNEDGSVYLSFTSTQLTETLHWIMTFGQHVKVLNPPELKNLIEEEIKGMGRLYGIQEN